MNRKDLDALNELYLSVYDGEQLDEAPQPAPEPKLTGLQKDILDIELDLYLANKIFPLARQFEKKIMNLDKYEIKRNVL